MLCSHCGYPTSDGQDECLRCHQPLTEEAATSGEATPEDVTRPAGTPPPLEARPVRRRVSVALLALLIGGALLAGRFALAAYHRAVVTSQQASRAGAVFAAADGPCRDDQEASCLQSIAALTALRDYSDGSLLRGDMRVARYLRGLPQGASLADRWRRDAISVPELTAFGKEAAHRHLIVFRSFWMYANIKQNHFPVPTLTINNDKLNF